MTDKDVCGWDRLEWRRELEGLERRNGSVFASPPKWKNENLWYTTHRILVMVAVES